MDKEEARPEAETERANGSTVGGLYGEEGRAQNRQQPNPWLGSGQLTPDGAALAGEYGTWRIEYRVGVAGIDDGGRIRLAYRSISDHGVPQFDDPSGPNYVSVRGSRRVKLTPRFESAGGVRPWAKTITIGVSEGQLAAGDKVTIVLGDRLHGGPGMRAQTYPQRWFTFKLQVDPFGTGLYEHVSDLGYPISGGAASRLVVVAPSDVIVGELAWLHVRALDRWENPAPAYTGQVRFAGDVPDGVPEIYSFIQSDAGIHRFDGVRFERTGVSTVVVRDEAAGFVASSNPIRCHEQKPDHRLYWGDLHGQTEETLGTGSIPDYFSYARDVSTVDVAAHSGNDFQITDEVYRELCDNVENFYEPGRFVTFHGYEWSGNTGAGGDHNVYYLNGGPLRRSSHTQVPDKHDVETDCYPIGELYRANDERPDVLLVPHIGGRRATLNYHKPDLERVIEIASQWGRFEWFAREALERGMRVGFVGGSDDHSGRPGWSAPTLAHHGVRGGLTAYMVPELTREAIWDALRRRRCYGTSGPRIIVDVSVDGRPMGAEFVATESPLVAVRVLGTAPLDTVELRRSLDTVHTFSAMPEPEEDEPWRVRIAWRGARNPDRSRALDWTGGVTVWKGEITAADNYAIDSPLDGIVGWDSERVHWRSHTCGDWDGITVQLEGGDDTVLAFSSPTMSFDFTLEELADGALEFVGPALEQRVVVRRLPHADGSSEAQFEWRDDSPRAGVNSYWIWVTQSDGELAWSSPIYVDWQR